jgi:A/G-specific adenine glycosylase
MKRANRSSPEIKKPIPLPQIRKLHTGLLNWFAHHGREFPWRGISDPYRILISEIMLQQTHAGRTLVKYHAFLHRFPSLQALARARMRDVVVAWRGLGYNNRAVRLHRLAEAVCRTHGGKIPNDYDALAALPGIGEYTANAILSAAFGEHVPLVDVNVRRFLSRAFWRMRSVREVQSDRKIWQLATALLPDGKAYTWNQALMDFGATVCTSRQPRCAECPVATVCRSRASMERIPAPRSKREPSFNGIPNRIYRGRIVEALRHRPTIRTVVLGKMICTRYSPRNESWLHGLLAGLQRDGLIRVCRHGPGTNSFVTLA